MKVGISLLTGVWLLLAVVPAPVAGAGTNAPARIPDRYLFLLNVSSTMRTRAASVQETLTALLKSGMNGEIRKGDQLGFWTFNDTLHTGEFELLQWDEDNRDPIARRVLDFVEKQRFSRTADFSGVMPEVLAVVSESRRITVVLCGDGNEVIHGTPFDEAIAQSLQELTEVRKQKRMPIVTVLRGYKGALIGHRTSYPPWPIEFPPFPPEPKPKPEPLGAVQTNGAAALPDLSRTLMTTNKGPIVFAEPLIVSGTRSQPPKAPTGTSNAAGPLPPAAGLNMPVQTPTQAQSAPRPMAPVAVGEEATPHPEPGTPTPPPEKEAGQGSELPMALVTIAGGLVVLVIVAGGVLLMRRQRMKSHTSLITRSMGEQRDRETR